MLRGKESGILGKISTTYIEGGFSGGRKRGCRQRRRVLVFGLASIILVFLLVTPLGAKAVKPFAAVALPARKEISEV